MTRGGPGRRSGACAAETPAEVSWNVMVCHVLSWARPATSCFSRSSRCLWRSRHALNLSSLPSWPVPLFVTPAPACPRLRAGKPGSNHGPLCRRSRWRTGSTTGACPPRLRGDRLPRSGATGASLAAGFSAGAGRGSVAVMRASFGAKGGTRGVPVSRAFRVRARAGVGAGAVRAPDCARETAHAPLAPAHAGGFFGPQPVAFCRNAERRPRKPPLSTFIIHHTAKCQAHPGTENEKTGDFSWNAGDGNRSGAVPDCPAFRAGAQPRSWRQFRRLNLPSTGCGGIGSHGWTPDRGPG